MPSTDPAAAEGAPEAERALGRRGRQRPMLGSKEATHGIYIEIVVLALIIALEGKRTSDRDILLSVLGALVAVVLAELYAYYIGTMIGTGRRPTQREFVGMLRGTGGALLATVPPIFLLVLGVAGVIGLEGGFTAAKWAGVGVIGFYAFLATRRAGLSLQIGVVTAVFFAAVGLGLVLLKQYFH